MASSKVCLVAALCSFIILTTFISSTESARCCMNYSKHRPAFKRILTYYKQTITGSCDINAIIFYLRGKFLCADPSVQWTKKAMEFVDEMKGKDNRVVKEKPSNSTN
ncbi:C-C motif chemokine 20b [Kryptolebias marmoratus]|uniref:C-C motif chemokine 20-like n=1 Tax=Kryptolebias marmoratus TaxID=37003 RepID=A0A3Q3BGS0_KRYMA|nr:C-C motif chemokine 20b [Kryptolebias marmoratus]